MLVYDVQNRESFERCAEWLAEIRKFSDEKTVILLVGNKSDVPAESRRVTWDEGLAFATAHQLGFIETSALSSDNVERAFRGLLDDAYDKYIGDQSAIYHESDSNAAAGMVPGRAEAINVAAPAPQTNSGCCWWS